MASEINYEHEIAKCESLITRMKEQIVVFRKMYVDILRTPANCKKLSDVCTFYTKRVKNLAASYVHVSIQDNKIFVYGYISPTESFCDTDFLMTLPANLTIEYLRYVLETVDLPAAALVNMHTIKNLSIPIPNQQIQEDVVCEFDKLHNAISCLLDTKNELIDRKSGMPFCINENAI